MKTIKINTKMMNRYHIRVERAGEIMQDIHFHNTVCDWWRDNSAKDFVRHNSIYIALGTGAGTHVASDLTLFNSIWNTSLARQNFIYAHETGSPSVLLKYSRTFSETDLVGSSDSVSLTEIGLFANSGLNQPFCLANFQDSEGQTITIVKTKYDVLTIDVVLELTIDTTSLSPNVVIPYCFLINQVYNDCCQPVPSCLVNPVEDVDRTINLNAGYSGAPTSANWFSWVFGLGGSSYTTGYVYVSPAKNVFSGAKGISKQTTSLNPATTIVGSDLVNRWSSQSPVAASATGNLNNDVLWQVMSLWLQRDGICFGINLPDHNIFPPTELEFEVVGDGTTTDFNLPVPILMADTVSTPVTVTINNVAESSSNYDWFGINWQTVQPWLGTDGKYMVNFSYYQTTSHGNAAVCPSMAYCNDGWMNFGADYIEYKFPSPITIDCVARLLAFSGSSSVYVWDTGIDDWTTVYTFASGTSGIVQLGSSITSDRWKVTCGWINTAGQQTALPLFGTYSEVTKPTIRFHSAPPANSTIRIKAYTEYPCKNSNWIFDTISFDIIKQSS